MISFIVLILVCYAITSFILNNLLFKKIIYFFTDKEQKMYDMTQHNMRKSIQFDPDIFLNKKKAKILLRQIYDARQETIIHAQNATAQSISKKRLDAIKEEYIKLYEKEKFSKHIRSTLYCFLKSIFEESGISVIVSFALVMLTGFVPISFGTWFMNIFCMTVAIASGSVILLHRKKRNATRLWDRIS
jgi:hypothetical protein